MVAHELDAIINRQDQQMDHLDMQEDNVCLTQANDEDFYASSDNNTGKLKRRRKRDSGREVRKVKSKNGGKKYM